MRSLTQKLKRNFSYYSVIDRLPINILALLVHNFNSRFVLQITSIIIRITIDNSNNSGATRNSSGQGRFLRNENNLVNNLSTTHGKKAPKE